MPDQIPETTIKVVQTKDLYVWSAPVRPFKKRNKEFFTTVAAVAFLLSLILFVIEGILPVLVIISLVFLIYVFSSIPPEEVEHKITNKGISFAGKIYPWEEVIRFWFNQRFGNNLLIVETTRIPSRLEFVLKEEYTSKIRELLSEHVVEEQGVSTFLDKSAAWLNKRIPLDN